MKTDRRAQRPKSDESSLRKVKRAREDILEQRTLAVGRTWPGVDGEEREDALDGFIEEGG